MFAKTAFRVLFVLAALAIFTGCSTPPVAAEPAVASSPTQPPPATPTVILPTSTPVISEFVATNAEQFTGSWKWSNLQANTFYILFKMDGSFEILRADAPTNSRPLIGTYSFDGHVFSVEDDCQGGVQGKYEAPKITQRDGQNYKITFKVIEDPCEERIHDYQKGFIWRNPQP
jgi:hypothetical protein